MDDLATLTKTHNDAIAAVNAARNTLDYLDSAARKAREGLAAAERAEVAIRDRLIAADKAIRGSR